MPPFDARVYGGVARQAAAHQYSPVMFTGRSQPIPGACSRNGCGVGVGTNVGTSIEPSETHTLYLFQLASAGTGIELW